MPVAFDVNIVHFVPQSPTISQIVGASTKSKLKDYNEAGQKV